MNAPTPQPLDPGEVARQALTQQAAQVDADSKAASDKMRLRADAWGKGLTTLGTVTVGYLGLTRATDVFPIPPGWGWLSVVAFALLGVMFGAAISLGWRLSRASRAFVLNNNPATIPDLSKAEREAVQKLYDSYATLNSHKTLQDYDNVGLEIAGAYERHQPRDPAPAEPFSKYLQIRAEVECAQQRAATRIVQRRITRATTGVLTIITIVAFVLAAVIFGIATDKISVERAATTNILTKIKQCGDAAAAEGAHQAIRVALPKECTS